MSRRGTPARAARSSAGDDRGEAHDAPMVDGVTGPVLTLLTRPGCHLCDDARAVVQDVVTRVAGHGRAVTVDEQSLADDPDLLARWTDDVPVVLIDGRLHARWRVDAHALFAALTAEPPARPTA